MTNITKREDTNSFVHLPIFSYRCPYCLTKFENDQYPRYIQHIKEHSVKLRIQAVRIRQKQGE